MWDNEATQGCHPLEGKEAWVAQPMSYVTRGICREGVPYGGWLIGPCVAELLSIRDRNPLQLC